MNILVGNKGNVDFDAPVQMTKAQQDEFIKFMESMFAVVKPEMKGMRVGRLGDCLFQKEWTADEIAILLEVNTDNNKACEMLGRTFMSVIIKRGEVIPDLMKWVQSKKYDLVKGDLKRIIEEYFREKKDLVKAIKKEAYDQRREINDLVEDYNYWVDKYKYNLSAIDKTQSVQKSGIKLPNVDEGIKKMKEKMEEYYYEALEVLIIKSIEIWNALDNKTSIEQLEFYRNELENDLPNIIRDFPNSPEDEKLIETKSEINQTLGLVNKRLEELGFE